MKDRVLHIHANIQKDIPRGNSSFLAHQGFNSSSANWKEFSLALKLERNNSQHLQNIPLLLEINYLYKKLHASTIAFMF